ncbi:4-hydroxyphenylacetate 3-hydroxylase family protein [Paenibacillus sp. GCM10012307]|uniref:4-hydroxyphenylacetate 3-hydroxylase n=1 Tax=Paenibacillus roseus TaxID=2798579 RepID=A0A934J5N1_9BACL|nr:4-hydroxyphenylacetate 3-hydroxylase N-terminal domain-containing protein [Paenibacillus roseus]MBJ6363734.1 4-hydroxyphenylacetate 3-hydroxylase [Paenibacillus roseus]
MSSGTRYLERIQDGRQVWLNGEVVKDIPRHPAFRGTVQTIASVLDLQDDPVVGPQLMFETETGVRANLAYLVPVNKEDIIRRGRSFKIWSDATFGVMSRIAGYYRSQITGLYMNRHLIDQEQPHYAERIEKYFNYVRDHDLLIASAGHDPQIDRSKPAHELGDLYTAVRIVKETEEGIVVRGAKVLATGGAYLDEIMVVPNSRRTAAEKPYALLFIIAANTPGVYQISRESFASLDEEDHPLSSRYDEMDTVLVFDDAFIPWERVMVKEDPDTLWRLRTDPVSSLYGQHEIIVRLASKLEFVLAVAVELAESISITKFAHVQEKLAELAFQVESVKALWYAAEHRSVLHPLGVWLPGKEELVAARNLGTKYYPRAIEILQQLSGSGMLQAPSRLSDLSGPLGSHLQKYYRGADRGAEERAKLLKLAWDLVGSRLGARHELYERFYSGDPARTYAGQYVEYDKRELIDRSRAACIGSAGFRQADA